MSVEGSQSIRLGLFYYLLGLLSGPDILRHTTFAENDGLI